MRVGRGEAHVDRRRNVIFVLDLGLGKRRLVVDAPQRRAQTFVDQAFLGQIGERGDDRTLERRRDRFVRIVVETGETPHAQDRVALDVEPVERTFVRMPERRFTELAEAVVECRPHGEESTRKTAGGPDAPPTHAQKKPAGTEALAG